MYSGGLDSTIAVHLLQQQGIDVLALHFVLPFRSGFGFSHSEVRGYAEALNVPLRIEEEGAEYLEMISDPRFGFGTNANPCIDGRIHRMQKAKVIMLETGAQFIATGEVVGQRPMSQRKDCMLMIEKRAELKGILLRPLSAQVLAPTIAETSGLVDRSKLVGITGRGRKMQFEYSKRFGLKHSAPAGGCLLTTIEVGARFMEQREHEGAMTMTDFKLFAYGRHFRISPHARLIVGRDKSENGIMDSLFEPGDRKFLMADILGPVGLGRGEFSPEDIRTACAIVARYSKDRTKQTADVRVFQNNDSQKVSVTPATDEICDKYRIA